MCVMVWYINKKGRLGTNRNIQTALRLVDRVVLCTAAFSSHYV